MKSSPVDLSFVASPSACYPEDRAAEAAEAEIALTLPAIAGLVLGQTDGQRLAVLAKIVAKERQAFIEMYGNPFGDQKPGAASVQRPHNFVVLEHSAQMVG